MWAIHQTQFKEACQHVYSEKSGSLHSSRSQRESESDKGSVGIVGKAVPIAS